MWQYADYQDEMELACRNCGARPMLVLREPPPQPRGRRPGVKTGPHLANPVAMRREGT